MKIGFTGTRKGMNAAQARQLRYVLALLIHADQAVGQKPEFHYGTHEKARLLADEVAAKIAGELGCELVPHHALAGEEMARNDVEAATCDVMIAAPVSDKDERSGTWATIHRVQNLTKPVFMLSRGR